jgi:uncharacterized membrane protein
MRKLSKEDIQFIDTYLKNSDVTFTDIRIEMVDHVASEIESMMNDGDTRDFYYIFKDYMVKNKRRLLKDSDKYYKACDRKIFKSIFKNALSIKGVVIFLAVFFSLYFLNQVLHQSLYIQVLRFSPVVVFVLFAGVYRFIGKNKKERFSSIERIAIYFMLIGQIINLYFQGLILRKTVFLEQSVQLFIITSSLIFVLIVLMQVFFKFKREYQLKYKNVS